MIIKLGKQVSFAALFLTATALTFGDTVSVPGQNQSQIWQTWDSSQLNNSGSPYWNNLSWDGANKNIGFCLVSTANCGLNPAPGTLPYLGSSTGLAFSDFYFTGNGGTVTATFEAQIAGDAKYDGVGWYNVQDPTHQYGIIFSGVTAAGATATFTPSAEYGLFTYNVATNAKGVYLSQSSSALSSNQGYQHFAVFQGTGSTYYVGAEDLAFPGTDADYNDMLFELNTPSTAPEPGALALVGTGLIGLGLLFRKKRAVKNT